MRMYVALFTCSSFASYLRYATDDKQNHRYWDTTQTGNYIIPSRTAILETIPKVVHQPPKISPKYTASGLYRTFYETRALVGKHSMLSIASILILSAGVLVAYKRRSRRGKGGFFRLGHDERDGLLGGNSGAKHD